MIKPTKSFFECAEQKTFVFRINRRKNETARLFLSAHVVDHNGVIVCQFDSRLIGHWIDAADHIEGDFSFISPWLKPGTYRVDAFICDVGIVDRYENACQLNVAPLLPYSHSSASNAISQGLVIGNFRWNSRKIATTIEDYAPDTKSTYTVEDR